MDLTTSQLVSTLLAIPAFVPATVCTGYLFAWFTNLHRFRTRSLVERVFWSIPLSLAISTIGSVLVGRFLSLTAVVVLFVASALGCALVLANEARLNRIEKTKWIIGFHPLGNRAFLLAALWIVFTVLSLVDIEWNHRLFVNVAALDQSYRVDWTESVLHTGVPPANPLYFYKQPAPMRNYYFWYVVCAAVAKMAHLNVRAVFNASCVWAGFTLAAVIGLYLKYFLAVGSRLRRQFLLSIALVGVTGLDVAVVLFNLFCYHLSPPADLEAWSRDGIPSWLHTIFWAPHHLVSMLCCMFAFLLAWIAPRTGTREQAFSVISIAFALSSAFGLSIYVAFGFFLVALVWAVWQVTIERHGKPALLLACGGAGALVLLIPYLYQLTHSISGSSARPTGSPAALFSFAVRQMIPPDGLMATRIFSSLPLSTVATANLARVLLLAPGYALELGFFFAVFFAFLVPAWRGRVPLTSAQRCLLFIAATMTPFMTFIRSGVLQTNDFAWRAALFVQFPLLLLATELVTSWRVADRKPDAPTAIAGLPGATPRWLRSLASLALVIGIFSTSTQAFMFRFLIPLGDLAAHPSPDRYERSLGQKAYISAVGYTKLNAAISQDAVVQFNPEDQGTDRMAMIADMMGVRHQSVIADDKGACGSEIGGDSSGCPTLAAAIDRLYNGATADQARATCRQLGIQILIARVYDPVWRDKADWVWTLPTVVTADDFRALRCA
jgi:hypothetical protein